MKIEKSNYTGYLWYSNEKKPKVYQNEEFELDLDKIENPFVIEGQLYDEGRRLSYSIKFVDGKYIVKEYKLDELKDVCYTEQTYQGNRMDGTTLCFYQYWREEPDGFCEGMNVLQPNELVFVGFNDNKEK